MTAVSRPEIKVPGGNHPISIDPGTVRVVARVDDTLIAYTCSRLILRETGYPPVYYTPLGDVVPGRLRPSTSDSWCRGKGDASYYDIVLPDGKELADAAWMYRTPYPAVDAIAGHVAFSTDRVKVLADAQH